MDSARDRITGEIVEAEQLWLLDVVDKNGYVCRGCDIKVIPASYDRENNLVRPYFAARDGDHEPECDVYGERVFLRRGRTERLSSSSGRFPAPYPTRLLLVDVRALVSPKNPPFDPTSAEPLPFDPPPRSNADDRDTGTADRGKHYRKWHGGANTLRPICRTFINFPHDRDILKLSIKGIECNTYDEAFQRLKSDALGSYPETRVFYAPVRWSRPAETEQWLDVSLDAGLRDQRGKLVNGHRLRVEWETWSDAKRRYVRNEIEAARREAIAAHSKDSKVKHAKVKGYLFFIGEQDPHDKAVFRVKDHRLICCLVDSIIYPASSRGLVEHGNHSARGAVEGRQSAASNQAMDAKMAGSSFYGNGIPQAPRQQDIDKRRVVREVPTTLHLATPEKIRQVIIEKWRIVQHEMEALREEGIRRWRIFWGKD
jgi:hypothetical protein